MQSIPRSTILFVDDDDAVRRLIRRILAADFELLEAERADAAVAVAAAAPGSIDLLLTDVVMPGGGGETLARNLLATRKDLRVLYMTGYGAAAVMPGGLSRPSDCLQKPFTARSLRDAIHRALGTQEGE